MRERTTTGTLEVICVAALAAFVAILGAEHLLNPQLSPDQARISEYANARGGWLMTIGFASWAVALAAAARVVYRDRGGHGDATTAALLGLAFLGLIVVAVFPTETSAGRLRPGHELTWTGRAHDLGSGVASIALAAAAIVGTLRDLQRRRRPVLVPLVVAALVVAGIAVTEADAPGLRQRVLVIGAVAWLAAGVRRPAMSVKPNSR